MTIGVTVNSQLIPPPELASLSVKHLPLEKRVELGRVGGRERCPRAGRPTCQNRPAGGLEVAYRAWYARHMEEHERALFAFAENLARREIVHGK
jgi:hypothetical protein